MIISFLASIFFIIAWIDFLFISLITYLLAVLKVFSSKLDNRQDQQKQHILRFIGALLKKSLFQTSHMAFKVLYPYWTKVFIRALGISLKLHQKNIAPIPKQFILIGNHPSVFEDIGMPALFPVRYLAKNPIKNWWIVGKISQAAGTLYVRRYDKHDRHRALEDLAQALKEGYSVAVYPEGGCKGQRIYLPFHYGVFSLSLNTGVPILPVFLHYESQTDFTWNNEHILYKLWIILRSQNKTAHYYLYDAISPDAFESKEAFCDYVQNCYLNWQKRYLD